MNPLLLSGFGISIDVNKARLTIKQKESVIEFEPHRIPYDSIIIDGHYGSISFEAMRWLSKHDVSIALPKPDNSKGFIGHQLHCLF